MTQSTMYVRILIIVTLLIFPISVFAEGTPTCFFVHNDTKQEVTLAIEYDPNTIFEIVKKTEFQDTFQGDQTIEYPFDDISRHKVFVAQATNGEYIQNITVKNGETIKLSELIIEKNKQSPSILENNDLKEYHQPSLFSCISTYCTIL